jgi:hypothetical protein
MMALALVRVNDGVFGRRILPGLEATPAGGTSGRLYSATMSDPAESLLRISMSHGLPRCLHAVAELGLADALGESPRSAEELAREIGADPGALARTLRVLSAEGIFETRDGAWGHTPASRLLRSDHPQSMRSFVRMIGLPVYWRGFEYFADALRTGQSVQEKVVTGGFWKYLSETPEASRLFDEAMMGKAAGQIAGVLQRYDFSPFGTIADIGGGRGHLLAAVLHAAPRARGVLFDQPHVTAAAQAAGIESERLRMHPGDHSKGGGARCDTPGDRVHRSGGFEAELDEDARSTDADTAVWKRAD